MTDQQALRQYAASQDAEAFRILVEHYQRLVYSAARRRLARVQDIEDVVQMTFLKLARAAGTIQHDLGSWLYATTVNTANELIRRDATRRRHESAIAADFESSYLENQEECRELSLLVDQAILELPQDQQSLLIEHFFRGRTQRELAAELDISQSTVMRRVTAAIEELRTRLAGLGYAGAVSPLLASTLENLPQAVVPTHITAGLTKIGMAAVPGASLALSVFAASTVLKASLAAVGIAVVVTGAWLLLAETPAIMPPATAIAAATPATAPAKATDWRTTFEEAYALAPNENLKFVPPGRIPERRRYFAEVEKNDTPMPCIQWRWNNGNLKREKMAGTGPAGASLATILEFCANLDQYHAPTAGLPAINGDGDWIVRAGAPTDAILADLRTILLEQFHTDIRFAKTEVTRDALVASGTYKFQKLAEARDDDLQIFADVLDHPRPGDSIQGGGATAPAEFWSILGGYLGIAIVDETKGEPNKIGWLLSWSIANADKEPARRQQILDNITKQTGITFKEDRRPFVTWKLTHEPEKQPQ